MLYRQAHVRPTPPAPKLDICTFDDAMGQVANNLYINHKSMMRYHQKNAAQIFGLLCDVDFIFPNANLICVRVDSTWICSRNQSEKQGNEHVS